MAIPDRADPGRRRRILARAGVVAALVLLTAIVGLRRPLFLGNFGVVDPGRAYRSAQPREELAATIASTKVASILNLRGGSDRDDWYAAEVRETRRLDVDFYDFPMSATRRPSRRELLTLLDLFGRCRYPILIHCKSGSDRTGLAVGLYELSRKGMPPTEALGAFSLAFAHVPLFGPEKLHEPIVEYGRWLRERGLAHTPDRLIGWVRTEYRDDDPEGRFRPLRPGPRDRVAARSEASGRARAR